MVYVNALTNLLVMTVMNGLELYVIIDVLVDMVLTSQNAMSVLKMPQT